VTSPVSRNVYRRVISGRLRPCRLAAHAFVLALVVLAGFAAQAGAASPCATKVLSDWYDNGRIDGLYPLRCYDEAIDAVPSEIRDYTDAQEVIARALQDAARAQGVTVRRISRSKTPLGLPPGTTVPPVVDTSAPSAVPIPLLVLGGMSVVLLSAGAFGYVARRRRDAEMGDDT
jgi:hypothetical protein